MKLPRWKQSLATCYDEEYENDQDGYCSCTYSHWRHTYQWRHTTDVIIILHHPSSHCLQTHVRTFY